MAEAGHPLIQIEDLTKIFYTDEVETHALSGIHLAIRKGEYVAMSWSSGCGKSTLLSIIGLLDTPTGGSYQLNGQAVENLDFAARSRIRNQEAPDRLMQDALGMNGMIQDSHYTVGR